MNARAVVFAATCWIAATGLEAAQAATREVQREGTFWVQKLKRSEDLGAATQLKIGAIGNVSLRGVAGRQCSFEIVRRIRASSEAEAAARFKDFEVHFLVRGARGSLEVAGEPETELHVIAPQSLQLVTLNTQLGNVEVTGMGGSVQLQTGAGKVSVHRVKGDVSVATTGGVTVLDDIGGRVYIDSGGGGIEADLLRGSATLQTAGGDISVLSVAGSIRAFTAGGGIRIRNAGSVVSASTAGGPIEISTAKGAVTARNAGGPIQVGSAQGLMCESQSGTIRLNDISGAVHVETQSGSVIAQLLQGRRLLGSSIETTNGDITVYLPASARLTLRAETGRKGDVRSIVSDFSAVVVHAESESVRGEGILNGGGPVLRLAGNGLISIKRR